MLAGSVDDFESRRPAEGILKLEPRLAFWGISDLLANRNITISPRITDIPIH